MFNLPLFIEVPVPLARKVSCHVIEVSISLGFCNFSNFGIVPMVVFFVFSFNLTKICIKIVFFETIDPI
jgi:hypothetical protein